MSSSPERCLRILSICLLFLPLVVACRNDVAGPVSSGAAAPPVIQPLRIDLGTLGGASSYATDINRDGVVVGWSDNAAGLHRAFRWTVLSGMTDLGALPGDDWSKACCITDDGRMLGTSGSSRVSMTTGTTVLWSPDGTIAALEIPLLPGGEFGLASGFNERGDVVGWDFVDFQHAWAWSAAHGKYDITANVPGGAYEGAPSAVDESGRVLGTNNSRTARCRQVPVCWRPFWWSAALGYRELGTPEADSTAVAVALGLGDGSTFVGWTTTRALGLRPYVWREGSGFTILPTAAGGYATAINRWDVAVGAVWHSELEAYQATAWRQTGNAIRLSPDDANPQIALAVNDMGLVAGWSVRSESVRATLWVIGVAPAELIALATRKPLKASSDVRAGAAAAACLSNPHALVSRGALLACGIHRGVPLAR